MSVTNTTENLNTLLNKYKMDQQQAQLVISQSQQIENLDFETLIKEAYPNRSDLETILINQFNLSEIISLSKKVSNQFISELSIREKYIVLPFTHNSAVLGQANIDNQLQNLYSYLSSNNWNSAESVLQWILDYQLSYSIFDKPTNRQNTENKKSVEKISTELSLLEINIENKLKEVNVLYQELESGKKEIQDLINQKTDELISLTNNLNTSNTQTNQINDLLTKATEQGSRINSIVEQQEANKTQFDKRTNDFEVLYNDTNSDLNLKLKNISDQQKKIEDQHSLFTKHLTFIEDKKEFFDERINYLQELIGKEVGASLFKTFKQRKDELEKPMLFWRSAVPLMAIATISWIFFLFYNQESITNINMWWQAFAVNTLKSIPAIFLLFFAINQYRKERNFQEEYAFKSAVALTIDAYAGRLTDNANKDKLIMEAVLNIYKTPIEEKQLKESKTKSAFETIKSMAETTKELVKNSK